MSRAYPRSRGGTRCRCPGRRCAWGLSPLARGNQNGREPRVVRPGPIPARAGEPASGQSSSGRLRAYPRSRGGTRGLDAVSHVCPGLSPLARGNLQVRQPIQVYYGPIPARAGEPIRRDRCNGNKWAYPRSRGGTSRRRFLQPCWTGLSPLARGNRPDARVGDENLGPIPARAGEPKGGRVKRAWVGAYPRSRGGTFSLILSW